MKIAIAGYGVEGESSYRYFTSLGNDVTILDERSTLQGVPPGAITVLGPQAFEALEVFDMVVRTPCLPPHRLSSARKVWSATNEFFSRCPAPIIGVTGTKGKGTTCSLIASILRAAGKTVHLVGNIGMPALDVLETITASDIVVFELSSFQLWDINKSPSTAVVLMIEQDHLDVHASFEQYIEAKTNIVRYQTVEDTVVFCAANSYSQSIVEISKAKKVPYQSKETAHVKDAYFWYGEQKLCSVEALQLPGRHNQDNVCAAIAAVWSYTHDAMAIEKGLGSFRGLPHRLRLVRRVEDVDYYDDSIATTIGSAIAAINAFSQPKIIILGGSSKGEVEFDELARVAAMGNVKRALLIGSQAPKIEKELRASGVKVENLGSDIMLAQVVKRAKALAQPGDVVILSPACASFGMFKNYADRGNQFIAAVNSL